MQYIWCRFLLPEEENRTPFSISYHKYDLPFKTDRTFPFSISCTWLDRAALLCLCRSSHYCRACCWFLVTLRFLRMFWVFCKRGRGKSLIRFFCLLACIQLNVTNHLVVSCQLAAMAFLSALKSIWFLPLISTTEVKKPTKLFLR